MTKFCVLWRTQGKTDTAGSLKNYFQNFRRKESNVGKRLKNSRFGEFSTTEIQETTGNAIPETTKAAQNNWEKFQTKHSISRNTSVNFVTLNLDLVLLYLSQLDRLEVVISHDL